MSVRLGILLVLLFGAFVAYLTALNPSRARLTLAPHLVYDLPVAAVVVGAFLAGACLALFFALLRDMTRSFQDYRLGQQARLSEDLTAIYLRGVDAQLAGKVDVAAAAYRELLLREPGHLETHLRLAELARARGDLKEAMDHHLEALRIEARSDVLLALAEDYDRAGRAADALATYRQLLDRERDHRTALRAIRRLAVLAERWPDALEAQDTLVRLASSEERPAELGWLAGIHYEVGKTLLAGGRPEEALRHFRDSVRAERSFLPASLAMGDAYERMGEMREAVRAWERAGETTPALILLQRLERAYRAEGRPTRMLALYRDALARSPHDLSLAFALGRVLFELEMLDEAADQFQKIEVTAPDLPPIHAYLGAIFERRGQREQALEEYRQALRLTQGFEWPHACSACGAAHLRWEDRCPACGRWNTSKPQSG
jgi:lipopolysaccharide biosynthesis regulator YciM